MDKSNGIKRLLLNNYFYKKKLIKNTPKTIYLYKNKNIKLINKHIHTANIISNAKNNNRLIKNLLVYEPEETEVFISRLKNKRVVFDIGAHIGYYSLIASSFKKIKKIISFEILKSYSDEIKFHVKNNNIHNIRVENIALGDGSEIEFGNFLSYNHKKSVKLDDYIKNTGLNPDLIKMDIEGFEYLAIKGGKQMIKKLKPELLLSIHPKYISNNTWNINNMINFLFSKYKYIYVVKKRSKSNLSLKEYLKLIGKSYEFKKNCSIFFTDTSLI